MFRFVELFCFLEKYYSYIVNVKLSVNKYMELFLFSVIFLEKDTTWIWSPKFEQDEGLDELIQFEQHNYSHWSR